MPAQKKKQTATAPTKLAKPSSTKKKEKDLEESKGEETQDDVGEESEEEELVDKYGFRQSVELDILLPTNERELIDDFELKFIDRNF